MKKDALENTWKDIETGCIITDAGNASAYRTGDWRAQRPVWDFTNCILCGSCFIFCPEAAVQRRPDGYFDADLYYCKGCGICAQECPKDCIKMIEEE